ncbi:DUF805 domain-containing protein [Demequina aurantiaca]|uniref:DUF805 domain-containing protein n=1 Tax=Demequina aurantiaca TaxID=676200 RepID=UPI00078499BD|nr:DUF805 domain-containing protein [Demequina aurantiaca]
MTIGWFMKALTQYADFHSRARRREFWWFVLIQWFVIGFLVAMFAVMAVQSGALDGTTLDVGEIGVSGWIFYIAALVVSLGLVVPYLAVTVRRMHDSGRSGWWAIFLLFLPIVVWIIALFDGDAQPNKYGPDPKELER